MSEQNTDTRSLAHTKWNCKYHVVFAPKYRRKSFLSGEAGRYKRYYKNIVPVEGCRDNRGRNMPGSYTLIAKYPAKNERFEFYGISKRKK